MHVGVLRKHLSDLADVLRQAGAAQKVVDGVSACAAALSPFAEYEVGAFAALLAKADEYRRAGVEPDKVPKKAAPAARPKAAKAPAPSAAEVIDRVVRLYQDALNPNLTPEAFEQELAGVDGLKGPDLATAAERLGIGATVRALKTVAEKKAAIKKVVRDRPGMFHRPKY